MLSKVLYQPRPGFYVRGLLLSLLYPQILDVAIASIYLVSRANHPNHQKVSRDAMLYTDEFPSYDHMTRLDYNHKRIEHHSEVYVNGNIHTNSIEGFWSLLKRGIGGVYHAVSEKYLQDYINEYGFRYNHRKDEKPMFLTVLERV